MTASLRKMGARMPLGSGVPFIEEQRQIQAVSGEYAWDAPVPPARSTGSLPVAPGTLLKSVARRRGLHPLLRVRRRAW